MNIKSTKQPQPGAEFPKLILYEDSGMILLMSSSDTGTVIDSGTIEHVPVGYWADDWSNTYVDYTGTITISNK